MAAPSYHLFGIPADHFLQYATGQIRRHGAILKDVETGRIVGHLQQTGALGKLTGLASGLPTSPLDAVSIAQNEAIRRKLTVIEDALGGMQTLQIAGLATSVVGIGVTVAGTALVLKRLQDLRTDVQRLEAKIDQLPDKVRKLRLDERLVTISNELTRVADAAHGRREEAELVRAEANLGEMFAQVSDGAVAMAGQDEIDPTALAALIAGMSMAGNLQIQCLFRLDETELARRRAITVATAFEMLAFDLPTDRMPDPALAPRLVEAHTLSASLPSLAATLLARGLSSRTYVQALQEEQDDPYIVVPAPEQA